MNKIGLLILIAASITSGLFEKSVVFSQELSRPTDSRLLSLPKSVAPIGGMTVGEDKIYFLSSNKIWCYEPDREKLLWAVDIEYRVDRQLHLINGMILYNEPNTLLILDSETGEVLNRVPGNYNKILKGESAIYGFGEYDGKPAILSIVDATHWSRQDYSTHSYNENFYFEDELTVFRKRINFLMTNDIFNAGDTCFVLLDNSIVTVNPRTGYFSHTETYHNTNEQIPYIDSYYYYTPIVAMDDIWVSINELDGTDTPASPQSEICRISVIENHLIDKVCSFNEIIISNIFSQDGVLLFNLNGALVRYSVADNKVIDTHPLATSFQRILSVDGRTFALSYTGNIIEICRDGSLTVLSEDVNQYLTEDELPVFHIFEPVILGNMLLFPNPFNIIILPR